jgi:hypothetical protein
MRCQSVIVPSTAEYWHIGATTMRFGSVTLPSWIGVKSVLMGPFATGQSLGIATPIMQSRLTTEARRASSQPSVPAGRIGSTM